MIMLIRNNVTSVVVPEEGDMEVQAGKGQTPKWAHQHDRRSMSSLVVILRSPRCWAPPRFIDPRRKEAQEERVIRRHPCGGASFRRLTPARLQALNAATVGRLTPSRFNAATLDAS